MQKSATKTSGARRVKINEDAQADAKTTSELRSMPVMNAASATAPCSVGNARRPWGMVPRALVSFVDVTNGVSEHMVFLK